MNNKSIIKNSIEYFCSFYFVRRQKVDMRSWLDSCGLRAANRGDLVSGTEFWILTPDALDELGYEDSPQSELSAMVLDNPAVRGGKTVYFYYAVSGRKDFMSLEDFLSAEIFLCVVRKSSDQVRARAV